MGPRSGEMHAQRKKWPISGFRHSHQVFAILRFSLRLSVADQRRFPFFFGCSRMTWPVGFLFTPQQLQGSVKYSSGVRLGNWREDDALDDLRLMDYVEAKERGSLTLTAKREMRTPQIAQRTLSTASSDGIVRNGDLLQLTHLSGALPQRCSTEADATKPRHSPKRRSLQPRARPHPHPTPTIPPTPHTDPSSPLRSRGRGQHGSAAQRAR